MNQRALSQVGSPILIEDAMLYDELLKDNTALRETNDQLMEWLRLIRLNSPFVDAVAVARLALQKIEGC